MASMWFVVKFVSAPVPSPYHVQAILSPCRLVRPAHSNSLASSNSSASAASTALTSASSSAGGTLLYRNNSSASHKSCRSVRSNATTLTALSSYTGTFSSGASATSARGESTFGMKLG